MSKEGDKASVFRTTKVRNKLKGDGSWLQRQSDPEAETTEEKPWVAEVRANRPNGAPLDISPVSSPTTQTPTPSVPPAATKAPTSGYLIRGVFTKTDTKPAAAPTTSNGSGPTSGFIKKPSESYKRIAPHTVRPTSDFKVQTVDPLTTEEKEKREQAARNILRPSSTRRSYVLSAAMKYDSTENPAETSLSTDVPCFVAKRVEITDDDESDVTETPSAPKQSAMIKDVAPVNMKMLPAPLKMEPEPVDTLTALAGTLIPFNTPSQSVRDEPKPNPKPSSTLVMVDDLLSFSNGPEEDLMKPIVPKPSSWRQEVHSASQRLADPFDPFEARSIGSSMEVLSPDSPTTSTDSSEKENALEDLGDDDVPFTTNTTRMRWQRTWTVNPVTTSDNSDDEEVEEQEDPPLSLSAPEKPSEIESPWNKWSAPADHEEKRDQGFSMASPTSPRSPDADTKKGFVYLKEYVNVTGITKVNPRDSIDYVTSSSTSHSYSSPSSYTRTALTSTCTYCGEQVGNDAKITIEHLNISCHPSCFKCAVCSKPMGDLLCSMFLHEGAVNCESCYSQSQDRR
ncbi:hypothetical protein UPYG_G00210940 [Umbra pygmaea]|uniref:LIM zinc-binding domain-containing protein n=1 Tax=Umbra pygmaea TaxID=75934 RepID=A0ABD0WPR0_UMBPY